MKEIRETRRVSWFQDLLQDLRYGLRMLRKSPGFAAIAILTLAIGLGTNSAIFTVVDTMVLRALPYRNPQRLVFILEQPPDRLLRQDASVPLIDSERRYPEVLSQVTGLNVGEAVLSGVAQAEEISSCAVSSDFFSMLGWRPAMGRAFLPEDEKPTAAKVAILSDALWKRSFGGDSGIIGHSIMLDKVTRLVVGVMPPNFKNPIYEETDVWLPLASGDHEQDQWIARIADGADLHAIQGRLGEAEQRLEGHGADWRVTVRSLREQISGDIRTEMLILLGCAAFVLLVACTNVANLMLARGAARQNELTVRSSVGASRGRIVRQILAESVLVASMGGVAGLALAYWTLRILVATAPASRSLTGVRLDARVLWFAAGVSLLTAILSGVFPALRLSHANPALSLRSGSGTGATGGIQHSRALSILVGSQVGMALLLLLGSALMVRSFLRLRPNHPGFEAAGRLAFVVRPAATKYPTMALRQQLVADVLTRLAAMPGVKETAATDYLPLSGMMRIERVSTRPSAAGVMADVHAITTNYFHFMEIPLLGGRAFTNADSANARRVAIVNRRMAEQLWPGESPLGKHFTSIYISGEIEVVGVVGETRDLGMSLKRWSDFYLPLAQSQIPVITFAMRTVDDSTTLASAIRAAVRSIDKDQPIGDLRTLQAIASGSVSVQRFEAYLVGSFAGIALALASIGIYAMVSFSVRQRTRELGIRIALGASSGQVTRSALGLTAVPVGLGLAAGWGASLCLSRFMSSMLYGLSPTDATANVAAIAGLCVIAGAAGYIPARRAARVDPLVALRCD